MKLIQSFDPNASNGQGVITTLGINPNEQLVLYNDSTMGIQLTFGDGSIGVLPPMWSKDFVIKSVPMGNVSWQEYVSISGANYPVSLIYGELYEAGEHIPSINTSMQRGVAVTQGNLTGNLTSNTTQSLSNTGNAPGTKFLQTSPSDNDGTLDTWAMFMTNDGTIQIADYRTSGLVIFNVLTNQANGSSNITVGDPNHYTIMGGDVQLNGKLNEISSADMQLNVATAHKISFQVNGVEIAHIDSTGLTFASGNVNAASGEVDANNLALTNTGTGGKPNVYANTVDGSILIQMPQGTDIIRIEKDSSITSLGTGLAGLGSKGVKRSAFDDTGNDTYFKAPLHVIFQVPNGTTIATISATGIALGVGDFTSAANVRLGNGPTSNNMFLADGSKVATIHIGTGTGSGTYSHGCPKAPQSIQMNVNVSGSATTGYDTVTATQFHATLGSALGFTFLAQTFN